MPLPLTLMTLMTLMTLIGATTIHVFGAQHDNLMDSNLYDYLAYVHPEYVREYEPDVVTKIVKLIQIGMRRFDSHGHR